MSTTTQQVFTVKRGDTLRPLGAYLRYADGTPYPLEGRTVALYVKDPTDGTLIVDGGEVDVLDLETAQVSYAWASGETDRVGRYLAELQVTDTATSRTDTFPSSGHLLVEVTDDLDD